MKFGILFWTAYSFTLADEDIEEEVFDEEAQLMASMGLPLAFASTSDHRRAVSWTICSFKHLIFEYLLLSICLLLNQINHFFLCDSQDKKRESVLHIMCQVMRVERKMMVIYSQALKVI